MRQETIHINLTRIRRRLLSEAGDVGNLAMMVADSSKALG